MNRERERGENIQQRKIKYAKNKEVKKTYLEGNLSCLEEVELCRSIRILRKFMHTYPLTL